MKEVHIYQFWHLFSLKYRWDAKEVRSCVNWADKINNMDYIRKAIKNREKKPQNYTFGKTEMKNASVCSYRMKDMKKY